MQLDLHIHSSASDGRFAPAELVNAAAQGKLDVIALTDHDTVAGVAEACAAAAESAVQVVPGIEISTRAAEGEFHILGYGIDPLAPALVAHSRQSGARRAERMQAMLDRLRPLGIEVELEEVDALAGFPACLGRPHLARALVARGRVASVGKAFERYLRDGGPAFVVTEFPSVQEAIERIHAAGGVAVWAHPPTDLIAEVLPRLVALGLDGVECHRPRTPPQVISRLVQLAQDRDLLVTGGSDWHGPHNGPLGRFRVAGRTVSDFVERCVTLPVAR